MQHISNDLYFITVIMKLLAYISVWCFFQDKSNAWVSAHGKFSYNETSFISKLIKLHSCYSEIPVIMGLGGNYFFERVVLCSDHT